LDQLTNTKYYNRLNQNDSFCTDSNNYNLNEFINVSDDNIFGSYLAGLWEGGGHVTFIYNSDRSRIIRADFGITFKLEDMPLAEHLLSELGVGYIRNKSLERYAANACVLIVNPQDGLVKIVSILNGYLRTTKISKFND